MPEPSASWNKNRDVWEDTEGATCLFCGQQDVFSETFPSAGMTRSGALFPLPQLEPRTVATGSSSSPDDETDQLLPSPRASDGPNGGPGMRGSKGDLALPSAVHQMLPTPRSSDTNGAGRHGTGGADLRTVVAEELMNRPAVAYRFGRFTPVIRRWESVLGRDAPAPTVPSTRDGRGRLNPRFCEWMMGLPPGWVTDPDIGLTRSQQLKALGNGVVPQQGTAAIADMLDRFKTDNYPEEDTP